MALINIRDLSNDTGVVYNPSNTTVLYAEDITQFRPVLQNGSTEAFLRIYNIDTVTRNSLNSYAGNIIYNTDINEFQFFNGSVWGAISSSIGSNILFGGSVVANDFISTGNGSIFYNSDLTVGSIIKDNSRTIIFSYSGGSVSSWTDGTRTCVFSYNGSGLLSYYEYI